MNRWPVIQRNIELALTNENKVFKTSTVWEAVDELFTSNNRFHLRGRELLSLDAALQY